MVLRNVSNMCCVVLHWSFPQCQIRITPFFVGSIWHQFKMQQAVLHKLSPQANPNFGAECITKEKMIQTFPIAIFVQKQAL